jgi:hypothetical protein
MTQDRSARQAQEKTEGQTEMTLDLDTMILQDFGAWLAERGLSIRASRGVDGFVVSLTAANSFGTGIGATFGAAVASASADRVRTP